MKRFIARSWAGCRDGRIKLEARIVTAESIEAARLQLDDRWALIEVDISERECRAQMPSLDD